MNNEEKILAILEQHSKMFEQVFSRLDKMQEAQDKMQKAQDKMQKAQDKMQEAQDKMQETQDKMQGDITTIKARLDYDMEKRLDAVNEGIDAILEQLTPPSRVEALEADMVVLKAAVKMLTQEVSELKKAQ